MHYQLRDCSFFDMSGLGDVVGKRLECDFVSGSSLWSRSSVFQLRNCIHCLVFSTYSFWPLLCFVVLIPSCKIQLCAFQGNDAEQSATDFFLVADSPAQLDRNPASVRCRSVASHRIALIVSHLPHNALHRIAFASRCITSNHFESCCITLHHTTLHCMLSDINGN